VQPADEAAGKAQSMMQESMQLEAVELGSAVALVEVPDCARMLATRARRAKKTFLEVNMALVENVRAIEAEEIKAEVRFNARDVDRPISFYTLPKRLDACTIPYTE
jgi:hypothetical protein